MNNLYDILSTIIAIQENTISKIQNYGGGSATYVTPVKGVDYWTNQDKEQIKEYVQNAILSGEW